VGAKSSRLCPGPRFFSRAGTAVLSDELLTYLRTPPIKGT
jgi:hypothetical protein